MIPPLDDKRPLGRSFAPISPDEPIPTDPRAGLYLARRTALTWADLRERSRVVILAEANSGKTYEFEKQVDDLRAAGESAFFTPIEQLAQADLRDVLGDRWDEFDAWRSSGRPGWFFLDSVDEAKLTQRNFELGLKRFAESLGGGYQRARLYFSCRGTDWNGDPDLRRLRTALPAAPSTRPALDRDAALLARGQARGTCHLEEAANPFSIVAMLSLSAKERKPILEAKGVSDVTAFEAALSQRGLMDFAARPGELLVAAGYWNQNHRLDGLTTMMEHFVEELLDERKERADASLITLRQARDGAERIAAAMTLGRMLTVQADGAASGAGLRLATMLDDWTLNQRDALLRRRVFAAATYGQARFTHRTVLEYLAARWFRRLLERGCPESRILAVLTARPFGVDILPPSLQPVAAWLAPHCVALREFILAHAPLVLMMHGDPAALAIQDRRRLLLRYGELHAAGQVRHAYADEHALWLFSDADLAGAIQTIWPGAADDLRFELLRLIEQGRIKACASLAAEAVLDEAAGRYTRIVAARALMGLAVLKPLKTLAKRMVDEPLKYSARLAPELAMVLFPKVITTKMLLALIDASPRAAAFQVEGFGYALGALYCACSTGAQKKAFVTGIAALCRQPPIRGTYDPISCRHAPIARRALDLLLPALIDLRTLGLWHGLVELTWVAEATSTLDNTPEGSREVLEAVRASPILNAALFWFGVEQAIRLDPDFDPRLHWRWQHIDRQYWSIRDEDRPWLEATARTDRDLARRRTAFAVLIALAQQSEEPAGALEALRDHFRMDAQLIADLHEALVERERTPSELEWEAAAAARKLAEARFRASREAGLRAFRDAVVADPDALRRAGGRSKWPQFSQLWSLTEWLQSGLKVGEAAAALHYADLEAAYSPDAAAAYRDGLCRFWRTVPARPTTWSESGRSTPKSSVLALAGLALEAAITPRWTETLTLEDARRAARHVFVSKLDYPDWLDALLNAFPDVVEPALLRELKREWLLSEPGYTPLLYRAGAGFPLTPRIRRALTALLFDKSATPLHRLDDARKILPHLELAPAKRRSVTAALLARFEAARVDLHWDEAMALLPILFQLEPAKAVPALAALLDDQVGEDRHDRWESTFSALFGISRGRVWGPVALPETVLADLLRLAYRYIRPEDDQHHEGAHTPNNRDEAQTARNELLGAMSKKTGETAYLLMRALLAENAFGQSTPYLHRLAHQMAEAASEGEAWTEADLLRFETEFIEPVTSGERLFALTLDLIDDISRTLQAEDVSARELVLNAPSEHAVQSWFARELQILSQARFDVPIEKEAPGRDRLDIVAVAPGGKGEVAIEVKHGDMSWTLAELRHALSDQVATRYLKAKNRRHGILVISRHSDRRWSDGAGGLLTFPELIATLEAQAATIVRNRFGPVHVTVRGVDAVLPPRKPAPTRDS